VPPNRGNTICAIKFADPLSNELLLVFLNEGQVMCLDTMTETFVQDKQGSHSIATIKKYSILNTKEGHCISISEKGDGCYHRINVMTARQSKHV
jgi:hypothetical protein